MTNKYEQLKFKDGYSFVIGCDEVGRGCLAGPVVAGAVILPIAGDKLKVHQVYKVIKDSKLLSAQKREVLSAAIKNIALAWSIAEVSSAEVDAINIHNASLLAMKKAVEKLMSVIPSERSESRNPLNFYIKQSLRDPSARPYKGLGRDDTARVFLAVDGKFKVPNLEIDQEAVIDGDNKILSIAAASIIAKVYRDELMRKLHKTYPIYNFQQHKGYGTLQHRRMILKNGLSKIHRKSFCEHLVLAPL